MFIQGFGSGLIDPHYAATTSNAIAYQAGAQSVALPIPVIHEPTQLTLAPFRIPAWVPAFFADSMVHPTPACEMGGNATDNRGQREKAIAVYVEMQAVLAKIKER